MRFHPLRLCNSWIRFNQDKQLVEPILKSVVTEEEEAATRWYNERGPVSSHKKNKNERKTTEHSMKGGDGEHTGKLERFSNSYYNYVFLEEFW